DHEDDAGPGAPGLPSEFGDMGPGSGLELDDDHVGRVRLEKRGRLADPTGRGHVLNLRDLLGVGFDISTPVRVVVDDQDPQTPGTLPHHPRLSPGYPGQAYSKGEGFKRFPVASGTRSDDRSAS